MGRRTMGGSDLRVGRGWIDFYSFPNFIYKSDKMKNKRWENGAIE